MAAKRLQQWRHKPMAWSALGLAAAALLAFAPGNKSASASSPLPPARPQARPAAPPAPAALVAPEPALRRFRGAVGADLSESLRRAGVPDAAARDYVGQMLRVEGFAREISVDDRFDLVVTYAPGEPALLVYAGMDRVGRGDLMFLKYGDEQGRIEWVDARGLERRETGGFALPVGGRVTSGFGTRMHPMGTKDE